MARMQARYNGTCYVCGAFIRAGSMIDYDRAKGGARHDGCTPFERPAHAISISIGAGYGGSAFHVGDVVRNPYHDHPLEERIIAGMPAEAQAQQRRKQEPEFLYVLHGTQQYIREDGMSFGVGDECGYIYMAECRPATDEESAALRAETAHTAMRQLAQRELEAIERRIQYDGIYPTREDAQHVSLTILLDKRTIYGGGYAWAVSEEPRAIWYLRGNGGDGDDWSRNNIGSTVAKYQLDPEGTLHAEIERLIANVRHGQEREVRA